VVDLPHVDHVHEKLNLSSVGLIEQRLEPVGSR
jgi:hypothetical protein